jgi:histone chaperone ASF1
MGDDSEQKDEPANGNKANPAAPQPHQSEVMVH